MIHPFSAASVEKSVSPIVCAAVSSAPWKTSTSGCWPAPDGASSRNVRERPCEVIVTVLVPLGPDEVLARGIAIRDTGEEEDAGVVAEVVWAVAESPAVLVPVRMLPVAPAAPVRLRPGRRLRSRAATRGEHERAQEAGEEGGEEPAAVAGGTHRRRIAHSMTGSFSAWGTCWLASIAARIGRPGTTTR